MPGVQIGEGAIGSEIKLKRRDGDESLRQRADIGAAFGDAGRCIAADPVIGFVARVHAFVEAAVVHAQSLTGEDHAADLLVR